MAMKAADGVYVPSSIDAAQYSTVQCECSS